MTDVPPINHDSPGGGERGVLADIAVDSAVVEDDPADVAPVEVDLADAGGGD